MRLLLSCVLGVMLTLVAPARSTAQAQLSFDWPAIASRLVAQLAPQPGEKLLILAHPGLFEDLIPHLRYAIARAGATDVGVVDVLAEPVPAGGTSSRCGAATPGRAKPIGHVRRRRRRDHDARRGAGASRLRGACRTCCATAAGRTVHFHWVENGSAFPLPGQPLPSRAAIDALYQRALLETDYAALARVLQRFEQALRTGEVHVTSPSGTDLRFRDRLAGGEPSGRRRVRRAHGRGAC